MTRIEHSTETRRFEAAANISRLQHLILSSLNHHLTASMMRAAVAAQASWRRGGSLGPDADSGQASIEALAVATNASLVFKILQQADLLCPTAPSQPPRISWSNLLDAERSGFVIFSGDNVNINSQPPCSTRAASRRQRRCSTFESTRQPLCKDTEALRNAFKERLHSLPSPLGSLWSRPSHRAVAFVHTHLPSVSRGY
jgi:hypothetical protein